MKKIVFVYDHLQIGGILTFLIHTLNEIDLKNYEVTLLVKSIQKEAMDKLPDGIKVAYIKEIPTAKKMILYCLYGGLFDVFRLMFRKKKLVSRKSLQRTQHINAKFSQKYEERFDIAIGADIYWPTYYLVQKICAEKKYTWVHPQYHSLGNDKKLDAAYFSALDGVFAVSEKNAEILKEEFPHLSEKMDFVENFVNNDEICRMAQEPDEDVVDAQVLNIVTVCRLDTSSKRFDRVIDCASLLRERGVNFVWRIVGDGPDRAYVEGLIQEKDLSSHVVLTGGRSNPYPLVKKSDVFVLLSQYEGVPLSVTEAMILGLPVVVSHYESAPAQVAKEHGVIVKNDDKAIAKEAAQALQMLSSSAEKKRICYRKDNQQSWKKLKKILEG